MNQTVPQAIDTIHDRRPGDVLVARGDRHDYEVLDIRRAPLTCDLQYLVRRVDRPNLPPTWTYADQYYRP